MQLMRIKMNDLLSSTRWSIGYIILIPIIVSIFAVWNGVQRVNEFEQAHFRIAKSTTVIVANEISKSIKSQQRLLAIFAKHEAKLIHQITQSPNDEKLKAKLDKRVADSFPNYFAVSIADQYGEPIIDDFDYLIGDLCREDLNSHARGNPNLIRIHPNSKAYHIDIIVPWKHKNNNSEESNGLLFVSFKPNVLFKLLSLSSAPQHELMLVNNKIDYLIEITETGTRLDLKRENVMLSEDEQQRRLHSTAVKDTDWNLIDFHETNLFSEYRQNIINTNLTVHILFITGSMLMIVLLFRAEKRRINAEKTKQEMFSLFNHDLRAPLNSIFGFLEIYTESDFCEKDLDRCKSFANNAFANALIMREIIDDILDIQKMEAGKMSFTFENEDIISLVNNTIAMNAQYGLKYNVKLKLETNEKEIYNNVDTRRIKQALTNLLSNAIKYSPEDDTVTVRVKQDNSGVTISVSDNGAGIEEDFQALVFDKFSQSKSKLTRRIGGTGLGLAIVKYIIDAHHGYVTFDTAVDKGTTFKIVLPASPN